jgi:hypothetical protein
VFCWGFLFSHLAIIVLTINQVLWLKFSSFTGSPIHPPSRCSHFLSLLVHSRLRSRCHSRCHWSSCMQSSPFWIRGSDGTRIYSREASNCSCLLLLVVVPWNVNKFRLLAGPSNWTKKKTSTSNMLGVPLEPIDLRGLDLLPDESILNIWIKFTKE